MTRRTCSGRPSPRRGRKTDTSAGAAARVASPIPPRPSLSPGRTRSSAAAAS
jgi:hypothetical protein